MHQSIRQRFFLVLLGTLISPMFGCSSEADVRKTVQAYLRAAQEGRPAEAHALLSSEDRAVRSLEEMVAASNKRSDKLEPKVTTRVEQIEVKEDRAIARVIFRVADQDALWRQVEASHEGKDFDVQLSELKRLLALPDVPMKDVAEDYTLVREKDGWKVFRNFAALLAAARANELMTEASRLGRVPATFGASLRLAEEAKALLATLPAGFEDHGLGKEISELEKTIGVRQQRDAYKPNVSIRSVKVRKSLHYVLVEGEVKNLGDRALRYLQLTLYGLDADGGRIFEKKAYLELLSSEVLKPGYTRGFLTTLEEPTSDWSGRVEAEVTLLAFEGDGVSEFIAELP